MENASKRVNRVSLTRGERVLESGFIPQRHPPPDSFGSFSQSNPTSQKYLPHCAQASRLRIAAQILSTGENGPANEMTMFPQHLHPPAVCTFCFISRRTLANGFPAPPSSPPLLPMDDDEDEDIAQEEGFRDIDDIDEMAEDEDGIDLFADSFERDYELRDGDNYETAGIDDDGDHEELDAATRRKLEARLNKRDQELARRRKMPAAFLQEDDFDAIDLSQLRRARHNYDEARSDIDMDNPDEELTLEDMADIKADNVTDWVASPAVHRAIYREFKSFLTEFTDKDGISVYGTAVKNLGEDNSESLEISYPHLSEAKSIIGFFVANAPAEVLRIFDTVAMEAVLLHYPDYQRIHSEIHVRITDLPVRYNLRQLRQSHLNCLVCVTGVVTRRTSVFPQLKYIMFNCTKCGVTLGPFEQQDSSSELKISYCQNCQGRGPFTLNSVKTEYRNYQKLTLQESPGSVPGGRLPRHRDVILLADLIDAAKPGDEVEITGIYKNQYDLPMTNKTGLPVFSTIIEANHIKKSHDQLASFHITEEDEEKIRKLSRDPKVIERIINSIAPSIYGHEDIKTAIALSLFGGVSKQAQGKMNIRGDINVLLLGDPGTAKSQMLKYVEKTAHRAVFATGQGASAVGLTANVRRDPMTNEWTLEGGALVLADRGTCLIDEFDKMNDQDRTSIHEAMEQQTISISKGGIVTTLQARCSIVAAANPIGGRYKGTIPFSQNVELTEPILSRFDILCVVRDTVYHAEDERLAKFVMNSHYKSNPLRDSQGEPIPRECRPKLYQIDQGKVADVFADMRKESLATGAYPITVRHLESIMRIAESFSKMRLAEYCTSADIDRAIAVAIESFVGSQKVSCKKALTRAFAKYALPAPTFFCLCGRWLMFGI
ncbi:DNA replication licensing factor mcm2 [Uncinocarpus reesii 1704]|uniref:DNA replication licensing factor MCM2 n=1 Tax=Uncinocarpus reesii (strain UAMH 1704) TaxID=336963 RepID=C4JKX9_UNCRE|nr:DNA replication licensing factor mcm2 [Uncinocarpus reesii 1704]EEP75327.1 DNA replication licensing factor mcm2 [Uncinocarpus reesii 1704]